MNTQAEPVVHHDPSEKYVGLLAPILEKGFQHATKLYPASLAEAKSKLYTNYVRMASVLSIAVDFFIESRLLSANIVLVNKQPSVRVRMRKNGKTRTVSAANPVSELAWQISMAGFPESFDVVSTVRALEPSLPQAYWDRLSELRDLFDRTMKDQVQVEKIRKKLAAGHAAKKDRGMSQLRDFFRQNDGLFSEEDVLLAFREAFVQKVMDS